MGVQALQDYVESHCAKALQLVEMKDFVKERKASGLEAVIVVDAFSCVRYLYGYNSDWVCGGQWSEMLRNVENFSRSFRQHNIQIVAFFGGEGETTRIVDWIKSQEQHRQTVHKVLNHVNRQANFPPKRLFFLPPAAKLCLCLAFRSCGVPVCYSFSDLHKELVSYCNDGKCSGLIGHDSAYLLLNPPAYLSSEQLTVNKKNLTFKYFDLNVVFNELGLDSSRLALFASLLGTSFISEEALAPFHWALVGSEKPTSKNQNNGQSLLPPNNLVIRRMVDYVNQIVDTSNYSWIVQQVFKDADVDLKAMEDTLAKSIQYYNSYRVIEDERTDKQNIGKGKYEHQYKKRWQHWQQHQMNAQPLITPPPLETNGKDSEYEDVNKLQENFQHLNIENNGVCELASQPNANREAANMSDTTSPLFQSEMLSPPMCFPTPPSSAEVSPMKEQAAQFSDPVVNALPLQPVIKSITPEVLEIIKQRHQGGQMNEYVYQVITKAEITIGAALEDEHNADFQPSPLLYRPIRQHVYGLLFDKKAFELKKGQHEVPPAVKEWCVYRGQKLDKPDLVEGVSMKWNIPELHQLWLGEAQYDNLNRMKAFLTCMQSDTPHIIKTTMVPQRLIIMCCVLRYLLQQGKPGQPVLLGHELDAFLAASLSPHISSEFNPANLSGLKLVRVELRGVQLASVFMQGVQMAAFANDACGCPVPWKLVCPWNYFDGKLFMSKYIQAISDHSLLEMCDGKNARLEKLQRMRWCITEGIPHEVLGVRFPMAGFHGMGMPGPPNMPPFFGVPTNIPGMHGGYCIPAGARIPQQIPLTERPRARGISSKRQVSGLGGTLEVAGVPVANWGGNRAGRDYNEHNRIVAGGAGSVELPSTRRGRGGRGGRGGRRGGTGLWTNTRNVTWAVEVDQDYDRNIGYKDPNSRTPNMHMLHDQNIQHQHVGYGNDIMQHGQGYAGNIPNTSMADPTTPYTQPIVPQQPPMNMHIVMTPPPSSATIPAEDKAALGPVHILSKPEKLSSQGRGRGIAATLNNVPGTLKAGQTSLGQGFLLDNPQQSPAT